MATVQTLIDQLQEIEDKDQPIIFQYYIAEHFIDPMTQDNMEPKRFEKVADEVEDNRSQYIWDDVFTEIVEIIDALEDSTVKFQVQTKDYDTADSYTWVTVDDQPEFTSYEVAHAWAFETLSSDYRVVELESAV